MQVGSGSGFDEWDESSVGGRVLAHLYKGLVGEDTDWADQGADGFDWWPFRQAQRITATPYHGGAAYGASIRIATEVRRDVPDSDEVHVAVAGATADLGSLRSSSAKTAALTWSAACSCMREPSGGPRTGRR
jgi:hypothetical protein